MNINKEYKYEYEFETIRTISPKTNRFYKLPTGILPITSRLYSPFKGFS